ncbi:HRDC domain-containing protein [Corynebacterium sp. HMSC04H06]|uniref:HRDC domain-containing protein n=1 Tax=Corynebacterium sp. HMSC04H06 TaxID=1581050 RepID=UPI0008A5CA1E|nr:HRDC domain-containing protein [Corynebacterium sp. HMSC04H06]OFS22606.1 ribonuclease D [Corynebacterium sp. HMSC04H06]
MSELRRVPAQGIPPVASTPQEIAAAAARLADGTGPLAVDTERAGAYRYNDRAFLLQLHRAGAGTVLIDPEGNDAAVQDHVGGAINGQSWVLHAAKTDLPCLAWLGLKPGSLFDTEVAARMAGFEHPNLGHMVDEILGVELEKAHGYVDWSTRPLPQDWLAYAALDVEFLLPLAETLKDVLAEEEKLDWALQEFDALVAEHAGTTAPEPGSWRELKGLSTLRRSEQLAVAKALWIKRDALSAHRDIAPPRVLGNKVLIDVARTLPNSPAELARVKGFPRKRKSATQLWWDVVERARDLPASDRPRPQRARREVPGKAAWPAELWELYQAARQDFTDLGQDLAVDDSLLIKPATLRAAIWAALGPKARLADTADLVDFLFANGVRPWQLEWAVPIIARRINSF